MDVTGLGILVVGIIAALFFGAQAQRHRDKFRSTGIKKFRSNAIFFMTVSCLCMWLPAALRHDVGVDNASYEMQYELIKTIPDAVSYFEPGFGLLCLLCKTLFNDYQGVIFVVSMLTGCFLWLSIYKYSHNIVLCILGVIAANYYFMSFTVIRQFLAMAILTTSIQSIENRNLLKFVLIWLLAISFHYTAIAFGVVYLVYSKEEKLITFKNTAFFSGLIVFFLMMDYWLGDIISTMSMFREGYASYQDSDVTKSYIELVALVPIVLYAFLFRNNLAQLSRFNRVFFIFIIMLVVTKVIGIMSPVFSRVHYYFIIAGAFLFSYAPRLKYGKSFNILIVIAILIYYAWSIHNIFEYQSDDFLPFKTILQ